MAKKKTEDKELKVSAPTKVEAVKVEIPNTTEVEIILLKDNKKYLVGNSLAKTLIEQKRAKLA